MTMYSFFTHVTNRNQKSCSNFQIQRNKKNVSLLDLSLSGSHSRRILRRIMDGPRGGQRKCCCRDEIGRLFSLEMREVAQNKIETLIDEFKPIID